MLYGLLLTLYLFNCALLVLIILMQKGKSGLGLGGLGGGAQMIFGGSGGQDLFQKITWVLGSIFMAGAMMLSLMKSYEHKKFKYVTSQYVNQQAAQMPIQTQDDADENQ